MTKDWGGLEEEGRDSFTLKGPSGREGSTPEGLGIFDLMSLEYVRGRHLTNFHITSLSSELSPG